MVKWHYERKLLIACKQSARLGDHRHCGSVDMFIIYHVTSCDRVFKGFCDFISGHRSCGSRDIAYLIFQVTMKDHVKEPCDFMQGRPSLYIPTLSSLIAIGIIWSYDFINRSHSRWVTILPSFVVTCIVIMETCFFAPCSCKTTWSKGRVTLRLEPLIESHTSAKLGSERHLGSGDIMVLVCHVISQNHVAKGVSNITDMSPYMFVTILPSLVVIGTVVVEI